jgi:hypothetical protein
MYNDSRRKTKPFKNFQSGIDHNDWQVHIRFSIDSRRFYHLKEQTKTRNLDWYNIDCGIDGNVLTMASSSYSARSHRYKIYFLDAGSLIESYDLKRNISLQTQKKTTTARPRGTRHRACQKPCPAAWHKLARVSNFPPTKWYQLLPWCPSLDRIMKRTACVGGPLLAINLGISSDDWCDILTSLIKRNPNWWAPR